MMRIYNRCLFDNFTSTGTGEIMISAVPIDVTKEEFDEEWANIPSLMSEEFSEDIPGLDVSSAIQKPILMLQVMKYLW